MSSARAGVAPSTAVALMLVLTFSTGVADAIGYLALDKVFTGNMTGNVVILGMGLAGEQGLPVAGPLVALGAFMAGAATGGRAQRAVPAGWQTRTAVLLAVVGTTFAATAGYTAARPTSYGHEEGLVLAGVIAWAMGLQAAVARHVAVKDVTTVVVTSTITGLAADSRLGAGGGQPWARRALAVVAIGLGALVGALTLRWHPGVGIGLSALLTYGVALAGGLQHRARARRE
ncbi:MULTISPECIES: YoaK family protein [unclassified Nocardioides]|uniref:YoaK family protein n=1 Tax=unclassified Nocardioides TaxID=2615069 RepID=UPI0024057301|nr:MULTISPECIES: YoaK family protein [unclassified Nocardioides]MDF9714783.1 DUF1275 domain-containing protein [Nocardioides sp. ChNu-99]